MRIETIQTNHTILTLIGPYPCTRPEASPPPSASISKKRKLVPLHSNIIRPPPCDLSPLCCESCRLHNAASKALIFDQHSFLFPCRLDCFGSYCIYCALLSKALVPSIGGSESSRNRPFHSFYTAKHHASLRWREDSVSQIGPSVRFLVRCRAGID